MPINTFTRGKTPKPVGRAVHHFRQSQGRWVTAHVTSLEGQIARRVLHHLVRTKQADCSAHLMCWRGKLAQQSGAIIQNEQARECQHTPEVLASARCSGEQATLKDGERMSRGSAPDVLARAAAALGSTAASLLRASAASGATMVTWPTLRWRATSALPYQCTLAPGTCHNRQPMTQRYSTPRQQGNGCARHRPTGQRTNGSVRAN